MVLTALGIKGGASSLVLYFFPLLIDGDSLRRIRHPFPDRELLLIHRLLKLAEDLKLQVLRVLDPVKHLSLLFLELGNALLPLLALPLSQHNLFLYIASPSLNPGLHLHIFHLLLALVSFTYVARSLYLHG